MRNTVVVLAALALAGCASVPKESVELSATVGRDVAELHAANRQLVRLLYGRIRADIDRFVDDVYAPYAVRRLLEQDRADAEAGDPLSLFSALKAAVDRPDDAAAAANALDFAIELMTVVREEVEAFRAERLKPVLAQEAELLAAVDRSFAQVHYANSIVTGHLASVVKVHDAHEQVLRAIGAEGVREQVIARVAATSDDVGRLVREGTRIDGTLDEVGRRIAELNARIDAALARPPSDRPT